MNVNEFSATYPQYSLDFRSPISTQPRVYDPSILVRLPEELDPSHEYRGGGRGRPNLNQTTTHSQCATCKRVRRNDFFYTPPSMMRRNVVFSHCRECAQQHNSDHYGSRAAEIESRRTAIWRYLAPQCVSCGFDQHISAMELHSCRGTDTQIVDRITRLAEKPGRSQAESLLCEVSECVPLCSNCHHMVHAGAIDLPVHPPLPAYDLQELIQLLVTD